MTSVFEVAVFAFILEHIIGACVLIGYGIVQLSNDQIERRDNRVTGRRSKPAPVRKRHRS